MTDKVENECKWLTCDDMFHMNTCMLKKIEREYLFDKFKDLKYEHPELAWNIEDGCTHEDRCFVPMAAGDLEMKASSHEDDEGFLPLERAAYDVVAKKYRSLDVVATTYLALLELWISKKEISVIETRREITGANNERLAIQKAVGINA